VTHWSLVRAQAAMLSKHNLGHVVHTHVPLSPSSIILYWPMGGDSLHGKVIRWKVIAAYHRVDGLKPSAG